MAQTSLYATKYAYLENDNAGNSNSETLQPITVTLKAPLFLMRFPAFPDELKYRSIQQISLSFGVDGTGRLCVLSLELVNIGLDLRDSIQNLLDVLLDRF